jgi:hypothetical protein
MFGFLKNIGSTLSSIGSKVLPWLNKGAHVGKNIVGKAGDWAEKVQKGIEIGKQVGKAGSAILANSGDKGKQLGEKLDGLYNKKLVGGKSLGDLVEGSNAGAIRAQGLTNSAKAVFANVIDPRLEEMNNKQRRSDNFSEMPNVIED